MLKNITGKYDEVANSTMVKEIEQSKETKPISLVATLAKKKKIAT